MKISVISVVVLVVAAFASTNQLYGQFLVAGPVETEVIPRQTFSVNVSLNVAQLNDSLAFFFGNVTTSSPELTFVGYDTEDFFVANEPNINFGGFALPPGVGAIADEIHLATLNFEVSQAGLGPEGATVLIDFESERLLGFVFSEPDSPLLQNSLSLSFSPGFFETPLGDFDLDNDVDLADLDRYIGNLNQPAAGELETLDLNGDNVVDLADFTLHYSQLVETSNGLQGTLAGDANLDGTVTVLDDAFTIIRHLGSATSSWSQGDFNSDGMADVLGDAFLLIGNLGRTNLPQ